jgi:hypothetical protein
MTHAEELQDLAEQAHEEKSSEGSDDQWWEEHDGSA